MSRLHDTAQFGPPVDEARLFAVVDVLDAVAAETDRTVPQVAIAWLLTRPTVSSVIIGARNEAVTAPQPRRGRLVAVLRAEQMTKLDAVSETTAAYPDFADRRQEGFALLDPPIRDGLELGRTCTRRAVPL